MREHLVSPAVWDPPREAPFSLTPSRVLSLELHDLGSGSRKKLGEQQIELLEGVKGT